jgi:putative transcriptional regulator
LILAALWASMALSQEPEIGSFLVATDSLRDPNFSETVVLILHYADDGALGVAVNRPTWVDAAGAFPDMPFLDGYAGNVYFGGPVARGNLVTLLRLPPSDDLELRPVVADVYVSADPGLLLDIVAPGSTEQELRVFAGHAAWDSGQLEREIQLGSWRVVPAAADLIFAEEPLRIWSALNAPQSALMVSNTVDSEAMASTSE